MQENIHKTKENILNKKYKKGMKKIALEKSAPIALECKWRRGQRIPPLFLEVEMGSRLAHRGVAS